MVIYLLSIMPSTWQGNYFSIYTHCKTGMLPANRFSLSVYQRGQRIPRLYSIWVDRGDSGDGFLKSVMDCLGWIIQVVLPPQHIQGLVLRKKRSVVEQSFSWLN